MPTRRSIPQHLSGDELERRYRAAKAPVARSHAPRYNQAGPRGWGISGTRTPAVSACYPRPNAPRSPPPSRRPHPMAPSGRGPPRRHGWRLPWGTRCIRSGVGSCDGAWAGRPRCRDHVTPRLLPRPRRRLNHPPGSGPGSPTRLSAGCGNAMDNRPASCWAQTDPDAGCGVPVANVPGRLFNTAPSGATSTPWCLRPLTARREFAQAVSAGRGQQLLLVLDGAGWQSSPHVRVPVGVPGHFLPPYSPNRRRPSGCGRSPMRF